MVQLLCGMGRAEAGLSFNCGGVTLQILLPLAGHRKRSQQTELRRPLPFLIQDCLRQSHVSCPCSLSVELPASVLRLIRWLTPVSYFNSQKLLLISECLSATAWITLVAQIQYVGMETRYSRAEILSNGLLRRLAVLPNFYTGHPVPNTHSACGDILLRPLKMHLKAVDTFEPIFYFITCNFKNKTN